MTESTLSNGFPKSAEQHGTTNGLKKKNPSNYKRELVWRNIIIFIIIHAMTLYALYKLFTFQVKFTSFLAQYIFAMINILGITAGAHRLWTHRTYQANLPLRIILMILHTAALQNPIYEWARDHRVHHKFTDTDADPHNATRGFFFSHMGWLLVKKHPDVIEKGKTIDMSDLEADPVVRFQRKYYIPLIIIFNQLIPVLCTYYVLQESLVISITGCMARYVLQLHGTWCVNSAAHMWGMKPFDKNILASESNIPIYLLAGEGFHNYHHTFPWDYKAGELGNYGKNITTAFIDLMAKIGWATELKVASSELIKKRALRTGDGSWQESNKAYGNNKKYDKEISNEDIENSCHLWGWGDSDMKSSQAKVIGRHQS